MVGMCVVACPLIFFLAQRVKSLIGKNILKDFNVRWYVDAPIPIPHPAEIPPKEGVSYLGGEFPSDILWEIFRHGSPNAVGRLSKTCKRFHVFFKTDKGIRLIIQIAIDPLIRNCSMEFGSDAQEATVSKVFSIISSLPAAVVYPEINGPLIPDMQKLFGDLKKNLEQLASPNSLEHRLIRLRLERDLIRLQSKYYRSCDTGLDQKFYRNLPNELLRYDDATQIQELSYRHGLNQLTGRDYFRLADFFKLNWGMNVKEPFRFLTGVSGEFLADILEVYRTQVGSPRQLTCAFFKLKDRKNASKKLCIFGEHYKRHCHKWSTEDQADKLWPLLFPAMHLIGYKEQSVSEGSLLISKQKIFLWIPESFSRDVELFKKGMRNSVWNIDNPDPVFGIYTWQDLFAFIQHLKFQKDSLIRESINAGEVAELEVLEGGSAAGRDVGEFVSKT